MLKTPNHCRRFSKLPLALPLLLGVSSMLVRPAAAQVSITADITGTAPNSSANQDVVNALSLLASDFAPNTGSSAFKMTASIQWANLGFSSGSYILGESFADNNSFQTHNNTLYINPLDRYLFGAASTVNTGSGYADFTIQLNNNSQVPWDYTQATPSMGGNVSLASVLYHESIHSMGFAAFNKSDGSYEFSANGGAGSAAPTLWTTHLFDGTTNQAFTVDTQAQRQAVMVSGSQLLFTGITATLPTPPPPHFAAGNTTQLPFTGIVQQAANGGNPITMYAPATFKDGSSDGSHIDFSQAGAGLLYPAINSGVYLTPSTLELAMLQDIGWQTTNSPAVPEASTTTSFGLLLALGLGGLAVARRRRAKA